MNSIIRIAAIMLIVSLTNACFSKVSNLKNDTDKDLALERGYVLIGVDTNRDLYAVYLDGPSRIQLTSEDLAKGSSYILTELEAGEYSVVKLFIDKYRYYRFYDESNFKFTVQPGKVSYVGHLEVVSRGYWFSRSFLQLDNRSSEALVFMEEEFPNIKNSRKLVYGGPGEDSFLDYVAAIDEKTYE